ncbi:hypothetical protein SSSM5_191 [Synechococcus phage S-SSM5]|jgi:hypothetical protein|uniref:Uncharacterized protein n=1 Tax=Synechococcus phage S-SSM5 TaxID=445685 RepID=E3SKN1_9CAUD|nr:hypothetical protein SSSM5_191 [Synechococcus phage S-SSM5]ADO97879.1 hypothetical protein SSSM5_191 [Synechococcus phage S-SSM5]
MSSEESNKMSRQVPSQDFLSDAEWDPRRDFFNEVLDHQGQFENPHAELLWEAEKKKALQEQMRNTRHSVDKSQDFIDSGMTLITDTESDKYLKNVKTVSD